MMRCAMPESATGLAVFAGPPSTAICSEVGFGKVFGG
jgi:hypothetical protein